MWLTLALLGTVVVAIAAINLRAWRPLIAVTVVPVVLVMFTMYVGVWAVAPEAIVLAAIIAGGVTAISVPWPCRSAGRSNDEILDAVEADRVLYYNRIAARHNIKEQ